MRLSTLFFAFSAVFLARINKVVGMPSLEERLPCCLGSDDVVGCPSSTDFWKIGLTD